MCTYSGPSSHLKSIYEQLRPTCSFADLHFFLPISHFHSFSEDRICVLCFSSFSGLFESVGWIQLLKTQGSRPGQTRWESAGTTGSSKTTPLPAGNTHLEPCYSHTASFQRYFTSASCAQVAHLDPSASIILMCKLLASRSVKPHSQTENYNMCTQIVPHFCYSLPQVFSRQCPKHSSYPQYIQTTNWIIKSMRNIFHSTQSCRVS